MVNIYFYDIFQHHLQKYIIIIAIIKQYKLKDNTINNNNSNNKDLYEYEHIFLYYLIEILFYVI